MPSPSKVVLMVILDSYEHDPRLEKEIASLVRAGCGVYVLGWNRFGTAPSEEERGGAIIRRAEVRSPRGSRWRTLLRLPRLYAWLWRQARAIDYDVIICHEIYSWPLGWLLKLVKRRKTIFDAHEPYAEQIVGILPGTGLFLGLLLRLEALLARRADALVTVSPRMVARYRGMGIRRVVYVPNVPLLAPETPPVRERRDNDFVIGRVGVISPRYSGVEALVAVAKLLRERGAPVKVVLGGPVTNAWDEEFRRLLRECHDFVEYIGSVPVARLRDVTASFDVAASLFEPVIPKADYGYSTKIFDAMAAGVPVVSTRAAEDGLLVEETGCGIVVEYPFDYGKIADQLLVLGREPETRRRYGVNGRRAIELRFNWSVYEAAFLSCVGVTEAR